MTDIKAQTKIIDVETLKDGALTYADIEDGAVILMSSTTGRPHALRKTNRTRAWRSVEIETIELASRGPYQDAVDTYHVTFSGGTPSASRGWELPFATHSPYDYSMWRHVVFSTTTKEEGERQHYQHIRDLVKPLLRYEVDGVGGEARRMGATHLKSFGLVSDDHFSTTYSFVICKPNMS